MAGLENPLENNHDRRHLALESVSDHIRLGTPPFFIESFGTLQPAYPYGVRLRRTTLMRQARESNYTAKY